MSICPTPPRCFLAGTMLVTLRGEVAAETVAVGDLALTLSGEGAPLKPVVWVGRVAVDLAAHPDPIAVRPIRITAGAVEPGMPIRDLVVSPDHGIGFEDDRGRRVLVPAHFLVNGATVRRELAQGVATYIHVAVDGHELLMADGMAAESFPPDGDRAVFGSNVVEFPGAARAPAAPAPAAPAPATTVDFSPAARATKGVAPLLVGPAAHEIHARLVKVACEAGYRLTADSALVAQCPEGTAETIGDADGDYVFLLPPGTATVRLVSRRFVPAETDPAGGDQRMLGVAIARIVHDGLELELDGQGFGAGFLPAEGEAAGRWRWTLGDAVLTLPPRDFEVTLEVTTHRGWSRYWLAPTPR